MFFYDLKNTCINSRGLFVLIYLILPRRRLFVLVFFAECLTSNAYTIVLDFMPLIWFLGERVCLSLSDFVRCSMIA